MKKKLKSKNKTKPKLAKVTDRLTKYYDAIDFSTWWESFATDSNENGTLKFATVNQFINSKTKDKWKKDFLWWILGPLGTSEEYKKFQQFNWESRRENGHWYNSTNADKLGKEIKVHKNALDKMREVGKINIDFISRLEILAKEIDREYSGRLFIASLSQKENSIRVNTYFSLLDKLQGMMKEAQIMYGKTQGMDIERLDQFFAMFSQGMSQAAAHMGLANERTIEGTKVDPATKAMHQIAQMIAIKSAQQGIDLPDRDMDDIVQQNMSPQLVKKGSIQ